MYSLFVLGLSSALFALVLTPLVKNLAWHFGFMDHPDEGRKIHTAPIPRVGGLAILASVLAAYVVLFAVRMSSGHIIWEGMPLILRVAPAFAIVFLVGLVDDIVKLSPWIKLAAELVAAVMAWIGGIHVSSIAGHSFPGLLGLIVTLFWIVLCTNAINLIDGLDGLAAGVSLFAMLTMFVGALVGHNQAMALAVLPFAGALLGFLRYNSYPATIYLGDCGSLSLGFLLGCFGAVWSEKSATVLGLTAPVLVMAVPLLDVLTSVVRRMLRGQPIFSADRNHIHHKLLAMGLHPRAAGLLVYSLCALGAAASLFLTIYGDHYRGFMIVIVCLAAWLGIQQLNYREFHIAGHMFLRGGFRSVLSAQLALDQLESDIRGKESWQQCWDLFCKAAPRYGFSGAMLEAEEADLEWGTQTGWEIRVELPGGGSVYFWRTANPGTSNAAAIMFVDSVVRTLGTKLITTPCMERICTHGK